MVKKTKRVINLWTLCLITSFVFGQDNYELLYLNHDFEQILSVARSKITPDDYYWLSVVQDQIGQSLMAMQTLEEGIARFEENPQLELLVCDIYYQTGNYLKALPFLEKYQEKTEIFLKYVNVLEFQNQYAKSIDLLLKRLNQDSLNINYLLHLGDNYYQLDSIVLALHYYNKAFVQNQEDQSTANKLASIYLKKKEFNKSIEVCDIILGKDSTNTRFLKLKGMASFNLKDYPTAEACLSFLYHTGDSGKFVLKHLGISELNNTNYEVSRKHLLRGYQLDSNDFELCFYLGRSFLNSPQPEKGIYYFDRSDSLIQPDPLTLSAIYIEKQSVYTVLGNYREALNCYNQAYQYNPKPEYLFYMALMYQHDLGDQLKALDYYNGFLANLPPLPDTVDQLYENQITISLKSIAEQNIVRIKEDLFLNGK
jgi:tetratricopeptide (TPR) repeat protein